MKAFGRKALFLAGREAALTMALSKEQE